MDDIYNPKVIIIIPIYNVENTIDQTLYSIINQTYINIDIIVSNNFSTDQTSEILNKYLQHIEVISPKFHMNATDHVNFCIDYVKTKSVEYFAVFHGDDIYLPSIIEKQVAFLNINKEVPIIFTEGYFINHSSQVIGFCKSKKKSNLVSKYSFDDILYGNLSSSVTCLTPTMMARTVVYKNHPEFQFNLDVFGLAADYGLTLQITKCYGSVAIIHEMLIQYRVSEHTAPKYMGGFNGRSPGFLLTDYYVGNGEDVYSKGFMWLAHYDRLKIQDNVRLIKRSIISNNLNTISIYVNENYFWGAFIVSFFSLNGVYNLSLISLLKLLFLFNVSHKNIKRIINMTELTHIKIKSRKIRLFFRSLFEKE